MITFGYTNNLQADTSVPWVQFNQVPPQPVPDTSPIWSSMNSLPLKPSSASICPNNSGGHFISLCPSRYALSPSAASLMLQGLKAGLNHNYALPHSLQLCRKRRGEERRTQGNCRRRQSKVDCWRGLYAESQKQNLNKSLILLSPESAYGAPSPRASHGYFNFLSDFHQEKPPTCNNKFVINNIKTQQHINTMRGNSVKHTSPLPDE